MIFFCYQLCEAATSSLSSLKKRVINWWSFSLNVIASGFANIGL